MKLVSIVVAAVLLAASLVILVMMLFTPQPIRIVLETGQEITTRSQDYFTIGTAMILIICSFVIGVTSTALFYNSADARRRTSADDASTDIGHATTHHHGSPGTGAGSHTIDIILPLLREEEKKAVRIIRDHQGEILQNDLVLKLGFSKVKTTRILASLERKQVITKRRHGLTNHIALAHRP